MCDAWYSVKGSKQKWIGTQLAAVSLIGYTKPKTFLQKTWGKAVENKSSISRTLALSCCLPAEMKIIGVTTKFEKSYSYSISILYSAHYIMKSRFLILWRKNAPLVKRSREETGPGNGGVKTRVAAVRPISLSHLSTWPIWSSYLLKRGKLGHWSLWTSLLSHQTWRKQSNTLLLAKNQTKTKARLRQSQR